MLAVVALFAGSVAHEHHGHSHEHHMHSHGGCGTHRAQLLRSQLHTDAAVHRQAYAPLDDDAAERKSAGYSGAARRLRGTSAGTRVGMLTFNSTVPLRVHVDYSALNESTAPPHVTNPNAVASTRPAVLVKHRAVSLSPY